MKLLEDRIKSDGRILPNNVLKVDKFLNHQIDPILLDSMAKEWKQLYSDTKIDKILTIEASGIAMACFVGKEFGVPVLFAKKSKTSNISDDLYCENVHSYTHGTDHKVVVSKEYLNKGENVLIIDDFLATGSALVCLIGLCKQAGANVVGCGIAVEKAFQPGGDIIRNMGIRVESLARISEMDEEKGVSFT